MILKDVELRIYNVQTDEENVIVKVADSIAREQLIELAKNGFAYSMPLNSGEGLYLTYELESSEVHYVSLVNKTSDVEEEWFSHSMSEPIVIASLEDDIDYVVKYTDAALSTDVPLEQVTWLKRNRE